MTISEMLQQSGLLTLLGMAVVFSFIIVMILCMNLLRVIVHALKLDKDEVKPAAGKTASVPVKQTSAPVVDTGAVIAAIAAAVKEKESI